MAKEAVQEWTPIEVKGKPAYRFRPERGIVCVIRPDGQGSWRFLAQGSGKMSSEAEAKKYSLELASLLAADLTDAGESRRKRQAEAVKAAKQAKQTAPVDGFVPVAAPEEIERAEAMGFARNGKKGVRYQRRTGDDRALFEVHLGKLGWLWRVDVDETTVATCMTKGCATMAEALDEIEPELEHEADPDELVRRRAERVAAKEAAKAERHAAFLAEAKNRKKKP